ncbi:MAG: alginate lyase family protein [Candidatus Azobacteroides sp.]|nr:alginate lyase family protein [Candidatus Azobacteroides sp.]
MLTKKGVEEIRNNLGKAPLFDETLSKTKAEIDVLIGQPINVPVPKDAGGGYTHEQHKKNYNDMYKAGILYQLYKDKKYASFVKDMLVEYAKMYPALPLHPVQKSNDRGKLFWQCLNDCVWLVHTAQAYDCIYDYLSEADRKYIETNLFIPMVKFISEDNEATFNKIHNHGTWAVAGVGMIGYVTGNRDWVEKSLYGSSRDGNGGFMRQMDELFSPDGYFAEGPYYQRYSLQPFIVFAQAIQNNDPERKIFEYRDSILVKAVNTSLQMANADGQFFHLNDALDKTWHSIELVYGVNIIYNITKDNRLLSIAKEQNQVILSDAGMTVAKAIRDGKAQPFNLKTLLIRDGADGKQGGIGILRMGEGRDQTCVVLKATAQGMGHGHFDKLSISYYDNGREILQDYGAARFLNIEAKNGGDYLPENNTWAKQTIAHNTLAVDETSNYQGKLRIAENYSPQITNFVDKEDLKLIEATDTTAYPGIKMMRTIVMFRAEGFDKPLVLDIFEVDSTKQTHQYDLSYYYLGQLISTNWRYTAYSTRQEPLGTKNGYQYLWKEAEGMPDDSLTNITLTFLNENRFYSITTVPGEGDKFFLNRIGANDPNFNLRNEPSFMIRKLGKGAHFATIIEPHGEFNPREEYTIQSYSNIESISLLQSKDKNNKLVLINTKDGNLIRLTFTPKSPKGDLECERP